MTRFESLEAQVLEAQRVVDFLGLEEWGESFTTNLISPTFLRTQPHADTSRRALVGMPESWLIALSEYPEASAAGLDYLARYADRHGFVSIQAASRWLDLERAQRLMPYKADATHWNRAVGMKSAPSEGLARLLTRAGAPRSHPLTGFMKDLVGRGMFELTETLDAWNRAVRTRK